MVRLQSSFNSKWLTPLALFLLALLPRLVDLGRFLTADEFLWVDRSRNFLAGLTNTAYQCTTVVEKWEFAEGLACTLRTGHPGVTTMWTGSFGFLLRWLADGRPVPLHDYVVAVSTNPLDATFIIPERLGTVLITSLWVVAVYWLLRRLFGARLALVGAVLIALDPFHIALSRVIHHDALSTTFMTLSVLCAFIYWGEPQNGYEMKIYGDRRPVAGGRYFYRRRWLLLSGLLAGFGFLSKSPALYLMPFIALVGLWFTVRGVRNRKHGVKDENLPITPRFASLLPTGYFMPLLRTILDGLLWFAVAVAVVFIFWPAMWVIPRETIETVIFIGSKYATGGHAKGNYFLGQITKDPGALFYPVTWLYRTSPLVLLGILIPLVTWPLSRRANKTAENQAADQPPISQSTSPSTPALSAFHSPFTRYLPLILLFILGYYLLMTIGEKKQERYFLPVYPWLNLFAAAGLVAILNSQLLSRVTRYAPRFFLLLLTILIVNGYLIATHLPYYFTYYNPLFGGITGAARVLTIGWGEGLNLAADYLNHQTNPAQTRVASWYESTFAPFYDGPSISYSKEKGKALAGDFVVFYINQTQRRFPDEVIFDFFASRFAPTEVITLQGLDYAWIYPSLGIDHYGPDQHYTGIAALLAWQWVNGDIPLTPGETAGFDIYWEYLGKRPEETFFFRLVDAENRVWAEGLSELVEGNNPPVGQWREGEILYERGTLFLPPSTPPGQYRLQIGFYTEAPAVTEGELLFDLLPDETLITVLHTPRQNFNLSHPATAISQPLGDSLTLLGATWPQEPVTPAAKVLLDLYWRVEQPLPADVELHLGLMEETTGEAKQAWFNQSLAEIFNPSETTWQPGDIFLTRWQLELLPEVPPGEYYFELVLADDIEVTLPFGQLEIGE